MLKHQWMLVAVLAVVSTQTACFTTRITTSRPAEGTTYTDRQWFTVGGLAAVSGPAGRECQNGLSWAESKLSVTDWLINLGLSVAGGVGGALACSNSDSTMQTSCATVGATLVPFMLASRTVEYACAQGPSADNRPNWMPPAQGANQRPAAPAPVQAEASTPAAAAN
jgi:hypothetical protein